MKLLSQEPIGIDLFGGESQKRLADQIVSEIISPSEFCDHNGVVHERSVVLALEGAWGTGKSNVLKMVEQKIRREESNVVMVRYDVWEHRQELSRKSILEKLVRDLTSKTNELLPKKYLEKLFHLTGESTSNYVETTEKYHWIAGIAVALLILFSICKLELLKSPWYLLGVFGVTIVGSILYDIICLKTGICDAFSRLIMTFRMKAPVQYQRRFLHREDATVEDFRAFLHDVSMELGKETKKHKPSRLVIAFDNLDRVSDDEIRSFWGSIHVLFAEEKSKRPSNIQVIIPYDRNRIRKALGSCDDGNETIRKTVDLTYNLPETIVSDWTVFLRSRLEGVFNNDGRVAIDDVDQTIKVFDWLHEFSDLAPRAIIAFVNDLAVLNRVINSSAVNESDRIPLAYMALYLLGWRRFKEKEAFSKKDSEKAKEHLSTKQGMIIGSREFSDKALSIDWRNKDQLIISGAFLAAKSEAAWKWYLNQNQMGNSSVYMAAVIYQLPVGKAKEVLYYQRLGIALESGEAGYVQKEQTADGFHKVFSIIIRQVRYFDYVAAALEGLQGNDAQMYWDEFYNTRRDEIVNSHGIKPIVNKCEAILLRHISNWLDLHTRLFNCLINNREAMFNENLQVQFLQSEEKELKKVGRTLIGNFALSPMSPKETLKFIRAAKNDYKLLNLCIDYKNLQDYLVALALNNIAEECDGIQYLTLDDLNKMPNLHSIMIQKQHENDIPENMAVLVRLVMSKYHER